MSTYGHYMLLGCGALQHEVMIGGKGALSFGWVPFSTQKEPGKGYAF
jgi:hypothetical protein